MRSEEVVRECVEEPRMDDILECAQRACLRMAEVTVMHSVTTSDTGSTATWVEAVKVVIVLCRTRQEFGGL